ncbi:MAG TPA: hypothetical protein VFV38_24210 [Ktedonobacteraceae bacterium]|nr:hypothetical protein [Ktedonobacteraceae bacterium]
MSHADIGMAKYIQERFPISGGMLHALKTYVHRCDWQEVKPPVYLAPLDGGVEVVIPRNPFEPDVISAAQAVADAFEMLALQLNITLEEAIDRVKLVFVEEQKGELQAANHCAAVSQAGVVIYDFRDLDLSDPDDQPGDEGTVLLDPLEAVQIAEHILSQRAMLVALHMALEAEFEMLAPELTEELRKQTTPQGFSSLMWEVAVAHAYTTLYVRDGTKIKAWRQAAYKGRFILELKERLFIRYFNTHYKAQFLPPATPDEKVEEDEAETDEYDDRMAPRVVDRIRYE